MIYSLIHIICYIYTYMLSTWTGIDDEKVLFRARRVGIVNEQP
jgi:hypothetical protein